MILLAFFRSVCVAWTNLMSPLMAADVPHWCAPPNSEIDHSWWKEHGIPKTEKGLPEECLMFAWSPTSGVNVSQTLPCSQGWAYDKIDYGETATSEWNLVCGDSWKRSAMQSIIMGGAFFGVIVFGKLCDSLGRKRVLILGLGTMFLTSIPAAFVSSFFMFNLLRFLMSSAAAGITAAAVTIVVEILPIKDRIFMNLGFGMGYNTVAMFIPLLSYYLKSFRTMQLAVGFAGLLLLPFLFLIHESPKWLLAKQRFEDTEEVVVKILKRNKRPIPDMKEAMSKLVALAQSQTAEQCKNLGFIDIFKNGTLRRNAILNGFNCFSWSVKGYYLILNAHRLPGNPRLNFAISTLSEYPAALTAMYLIRNCRRRPSQIISVFLSAVLFVIIFFVNEDQAAIKVWGSTLIRLFVSLFGYVKWITVHEIYPTPARGAGFALSMMTSRIGAMVAPFVRDLSKWVHPTAPLIIFVVLSLLDMLCLRLLPETLNVPLPDTIEEVKRFRKSTKSKHLVNMEELRAEK